MKSLFGRLLLSLIVVNVAATLGVSLVYGRDFDRQRTRHEHLMSDALILHGSEAVRAARAGNTRELEASLARLEERTGLVAVVVEQGRLLAGRADVSALDGLLREAERSREVVRREVDDARWLALSPAGPGGPIVAGRLPPRAFRIAPHDMQLLLVSALSTLVSFLLARFLSGPLGTLRRATNRLATGDTSVRVTPSLARTADSEVLALASDFDRMAGRIEGLLDAQSRLLRDVSHELRSPLTRLSVALELVRKQSGPRAREGLGRIEREVERLDELIALMLTMTKLEHAESIQKDDAVKLDELVEEIRADAQFEAQDKGRAVRVTQRAALTLPGNEELLRQAIENVVRNAIKFTPEGSTVDVALCEEVREGVRWAVIETCDRGPGVPEAALDDIFQPFTRVDSARDRSAGGAGLGLAITARAARVHGGSVRAGNRDGGGLCVRIALPLEPVI